MLIIYILFTLKDLSKVFAVYEKWGMRNEKGEKRKEKWEMIIEKRTNNHSPK